MAYVVPAVLGGLAIAVMALVSSYASRKRTKSLRHPSEVSTARVLIHSINDDRCTGCDACVAVCPTNVLDLVENKSRVLQFQDCIQCEACMWACPTTALVMHPEGTEPPAYKMPELDEFFQTAVPGQYLIGEVAGKPLVKNAANLGRGVVEHMLKTGLSPSNQNGLYDVAIVGSGPGGLSAALSCVQRGLSYVVLDKENLIASTVARYPKGKLIMAEPYDIPNLSLLPVFDSSKEEMVPIWRDVISRVGITVKLNETVETVTRRSDGIFEIDSNGGQYHAQRVVLATGLRGKPRTLGVTGENQAKVYSLLEDPDEFRGQAVCVVGGGDSALEAAIALADAGAKVVLSYRGRSFARAQQKNKKLAESYADERRIKIKYMSQILEFAADTVTLEMSDGTKKRYPNQAAFVLIGADPPIRWLNKLGIHYVERPHMFELSASDDLVRRFLGESARDCPASAELAAKLVRNEEVPLVETGASHRHQLVSNSDDEKTILGAPGPGVSAPRRFLRAATSMFRHSGKLDKPMPLSEFAKAQRRHSGRGRRDQLDAGERTRILRMLRDEGGRKADEESKIFFLEDLAKPDSERGSWHQKQSAGHEEIEFESLLGVNEGVNNEGANEGTANGPPPAPGLPNQAMMSPAKPAVIVGLARATAEGPRASRSPQGAVAVNAPPPLAAPPSPPSPSLEPPLLPELFRAADNRGSEQAPPRRSRSMSTAPIAAHQDSFFSANPDEATQFASLSDYDNNLSTDFEDGEATQLMDAAAAAQFMAGLDTAPAAASPVPKAPPIPVAKAKSSRRPAPTSVPPPIPSAAKHRNKKAAKLPPPSSSPVVSSTPVPRGDSASSVSAPVSLGLYSTDFEDDERTMLANFDPQELMRQVAEADKVRASEPQSLPQPPIPPSSPPASGLDPNILFSNDDIEAATAAIDNNRLPTDGGHELDADALTVGEHTGTRVESLSDVDWDLE